MNAAADVNRELSGFFKKAGLSLIILTLVIFSYKSLSGYTEIKPFKTYENCSIITNKSTEGITNSNISVYQIKIKKENTERVSESENTYIEGEEYEIGNAFSVNDKSTNSKNSDYLFNEIVPHSYYKQFTDKTNARVKFYITSNGRTFPVSSEYCTISQAKKEYQKLDPPTSWYIAYGVGILAGCIMLIMSRNILKTAVKYEESEGTILGDPSPFDSKEEALEYFWTGKLRNDKVQKEFDRAPRLTKYGDSKFTVLMRHSGDEKRRFEEHKKNKHLQ